MHLSWDFASVQPGVLATQQPKPAYFPRYQFRMGNYALSPGDRARAKRRFYASVGVRELLIVGRYPWELELYRLLDGSLDLVGKSTLDDNESIASAILPIRMRIVPDEPRPMIEITATLQARCWTV